MKISRNWLEDYIDINRLTNIEISEGLTRSGIEVESVTPLTSVKGVIVAMILNVKPHPTSDKLSICTVDIGNNATFDVVCGASNVREYIKVAFAPIGVVINGTEIKESNIRGINSFGMLCSLEELGINSSLIRENSENEILVLPNNFELGGDVIELMNFNDTIFDLSLTPNRSDCLSVIGLAYEISAIFDIPLKKKTIKYPEVENESEFVNLLVSNNNVNYFSVMPLHNIKVGDSPQFIKSRLMSCGIKPINNVVDITNYILIEIGQPLHIFDLAKSTQNIEVRNAFKNETIKLLDEKDYCLDTDDIVVANQEVCLSLAGIMGGMNSRVTKYTENILLECAVFNSQKIRKSSKKHLLRSESSIRYEKGIDINKVEIAQKMAVELLIKYASAKLSTKQVYYKSEEFEFEENYIELEYQKLVKYLGFNIDVNEVAKIFNRLQFSYTFENSIFKVKKMSRRADLQFDVCLIEEILRLYGVNKIKKELPKSKLKRAYVADYDRTLTAIKNILHSMGYSECINYSLTSKSKAYISLSENESLIQLKNPLSSEREFMRKTLIPSLIDTAVYNLERQASIVRLYEISQINFLKDNENVTHNKITAMISGFTIEKPLFDVKIKGDFYLIKGALQKLLSMAGLTEGRDYFVKSSDNIPNIFHPNQSGEIILYGKVVGYVGKIHPKYSKYDLYTFEIDFYELKKLFSEDITLGTLSVYPSISRDLSIVVEKEINSIDMIKSVHNLDIDILEDISIYDIYYDEKLQNKKSLTFRIIFRSNISTLSDETVLQKLKMITDVFRLEYNGELR
ncbi:MAG: phenylalanine--tRNA ligase subunit beta [Bacilli bacterium]